MRYFLRFSSLFLLILCCVLAAGHTPAADTDTATPENPAAASRDAVKPSDAAPGAASAVLPAGSADSATTGNPAPAAGQAPQGTPSAQETSPAAAPLPVQPQAAPAAPAANGDESAAPAPRPGTSEKKEPAKAKAEKKASPKPKTEKKENAAPKADKKEARPAAADKKDAPAAQEEENATAQEEEKSGVLHDPWEMVWSSQHSMLEEVNGKALAMSDTFADRALNVSEKVQPFVDEARRLLVLSNTYKNMPNAMEAVSRRLTVTITEVRKILSPMMDARSEAQGLLERISYLADSLPEDLHDERLSSEMQEYIQALAMTRLRLTAVLAQYDTALAPSLALLNRLEKTREEISSQLPALWKDYYLQKPVPWLSPAAWADFPKQMTYSYQGLLLRIPVEVPVTPENWGTAVLRFFMCLLFAGVITVLLSRRWLNETSTPTVRHIFHVSLPWFCVGLALLGSSISATGEFFRLFLALGNLSLIVAQINLAWDLRRLKYPEVQIDRSPFWHLIPLTLCAYVLLYLPLLRPLVLVIWMGLLITDIMRQRRRKEQDLGPLHLESSVLEAEPVVLWLCLIMTIFGLHLYSMVLYLCFVSCSLALQLSLGGMSFVTTVSEKLPKEGIRAALAHTAIALAAPVVLVVAFVGVTQWVGTLPGGLPLLQYYILRGVNVGVTQFNVLHLLMIVSAFYITRTAVAMGSRFLGRLPKQGLQIDATLIPPIQTAFSYALWCFFGLFVLKALGMELSNLAMVAGGLSVGIGFGMQTIVNNFLSGLILIFSRTLQAGDVVEVGGTQGRVRKISVRATMVETFDNALIIVPNSEFVASRLINWTRNSRTVRKEIKVGVAYGSDTAAVMRILLATANANSNVLKYPPPNVIFADFGASTLDFNLLFWVRDYDVGASTTSAIRLEIEKEFRNQRIEVAFPQLDIHIKEMPPRVKNTPPPSELRAARRLTRRPRRRLEAASSRKVAENTAGTPHPDNTDDNDA
ncbi:mechanosensitive ion channel family protein [Desulfovibrio falkowii]|uniref:Mechanosensitive ion channel n=1 Tax=Desulfovibrio falkowii TaxID=3136602 RepID=A0ABQ0EBM0_9BACT